MNDYKISLDTFASILVLTDWEAKHRSPDPVKRINGRTSIAYAANCFVTLNPSDRTLAERLVKKYAPKDWRGWSVVVAAAKKSRRAFKQAVKFGIFSDNRCASNYYGHYFYMHSDEHQDFFQDRRTYKCVASPYSKLTITQQASERLFWDVGER